MKTLPVAIFTHNRTKVACATVNSILDRLKCPGRTVRYILCDDMSRPGHVEAVVKAFTDRGIEPSVHLNDAKRHGLGASMNNGLADAFKTSGVCLRLEDDWLLKRDLDVSEWVDCMFDDSIGAVRLGMMFRDEGELKPYRHGLLKMRPRPDRVFNFNNQVALVTEEVYDVCRTAYPENVPPHVVERAMADAYNKATDKGVLSPWICWPAGWETYSLAGDRMAFLHIGKSTLGHVQYKVPKGYEDLQE